MLKVEDHTADIKIVVHGEFNEIIKDLISFITNSKYCNKVRKNCLSLEIKEDSPDLFFVNLVNNIIAEVELNKAVPICFNIEKLEKYYIKLKICFKRGKWKNKIKAATFYNFLFEENRLEMVLDV